MSSLESWLYPPNIVEPPHTDIFLETSAPSIVFQPGAEVKLLSENSFEMRVYFSFFPVKALITKF